MSIKNKISDTKQLPFRSLLKLQLKEASIYTLATFLPQLGTFLLLPLFWKKLSPADYGIIAISEMVGSFIGIFMGLSLEMSISRLYYEWPQEQRKKRLGAIWVVSWLSSILIGVLSILVLSFFTPMLFPGVEFYPYIFLGLVNTILTSLTVIVFMTIRIKRMPWLYTLYSVSTFFIQMYLNIYFVWFLDKKLYGYFISNLIGKSVTVLGCVVIMPFFAIPCIKGAAIKESLKFSLPLIPTNIISTGTGLVDKFILQRFASLEILGIYYLCLKFTSLINSFHTTLKLSYVPFMSKIAAENNRPEVSSVLARISLFYILPIIITGMMISIYLKDFVLLVNRPNYFPIINYVPLLMGPTIIMTFNLYLVPGLFLAKRTDLMWIPVIVQFISILISGLILIPLFQLNGVIISRYLNSIAFIGISHFFTKKLYPLPVEWNKVFLLLFFMFLAIIISLPLNFDKISVNLLTRTAVIIVFSLICFLTVVGFSKTRKILLSAMMRI